MCQEQPGRRKPLEAKIAKPRMIIRTAPWCPVILALRLLDRQIVDGSKPQAHQPVLIELPIFIAIRAKPIPGVIVPFIGEAHGDTVSLERPRLFDQPIVQLFRPFASEKRDDFLPSVHKFRTSEERLGTEVNITAYSPEDFREKVKSCDHFLAAVLRGRKQFVKGGQSDLDEIIGQ